VVPNGDGHIVSVVESFGNGGRFDGFPVITGPVGVILTTLGAVVGVVGVFSAEDALSVDSTDSTERIDEMRDLTMLKSLEKA
jgi:hypothetical protein